MDRWKERQDEGSSEIQKRVDSGILNSTISKGLNILVKHVNGQRKFIYCFITIVSIFGFCIHSIF